MSDAKPPPGAPVEPPPDADASDALTAIEAPPAVASFVAAARDYVRRASRVELDGSPLSLAFVDHYIDQTRKAGALSEDVLALAAAALGAYLGQVALERFGGRWVLDGENPAAWRVELAVVELMFWPVGMAAEALRVGPVDGYDGSFTTEPALQEALEQALSASAPVTESYYYSLTGRLETLEHAVDLLLALRQRAEESGTRN
jgi:hypothetical protein